MAMGWSQTGCPWSPRRGHGHYYKGEVTPGLLGQPTEKALYLPWLGWGEVPSTSELYFDCQILQWD